MGKTSKNETSTNEKAKQDQSPGGIPVWMKTLCGVIVFGLLLGAILVGSETLKARESSGDKKNIPLAELPPVERGQKALVSGKWAIAEGAYREMLDADQFDARSIFYLGYTLQQQKKLDEARKQYEKATSFIVFRNVSYYNIASIHALQNRPDEAIEALNTAIGNGFFSARGIEEDRDFNSLADDPEFMRLALQEKENRDRAARSRRRR